MKTKAMSITMVAALGLSAQVAMADDSAGCGIGKMIMEGKSTKGANITAAILNDVLIPRTFFMTTASIMDEEILGCDPSKTVLKEEEQKRFVAMNMDSLSRDMAQGQGAHLDALAAVMGIEESDRDTFKSMTQDEFATLFSSAGASAEGVLSSLHTAMMTHPTLNKYVQ